MKPMRLPWKNQHVPHGTLDIMGTCNISCKGCYNSRSGKPKPFEQVRKDFEDMLAVRRLHTVTLTGGEATMHPDLFVIVRHIKSKGIKAAVVTNGYLLDGQMMAGLKEAGIDLVILHIQMDQERPDLPQSPTIQDAEKLRNEKLQLVADYGITAGISYIIYKDRIAELQLLISNMLSDTHTGFALLTMYSDFSKFVNLRGSVQYGLKSDPPVPDSDISTDRDEVEIEEILSEFTKLGLPSFAYVASSNDVLMKRWYVFLAGTVNLENGTFVHRALRSSLLERFVIRILLLFTGKTLFFHKPNRAHFQMQLILNGLLGGNLFNNLYLLLKSKKRGAGLNDKHILLQKAPELLQNGEVVYCRDCPDSTIQNGILVPACMADRMADKS